MPIPKYDEMMLPLLRLLADGNVHMQRDLAGPIADFFKVSAEDRARTLPSGRRTYIRHRVAWAGFNLRRAGLAEMPATGALRITDAGQKFLASKPKRLRAADLKQFATYRAFLRRTKGHSEAAVEAQANELRVASEETPQERMEAAFGELRDTLIAELRTTLGKIDPFRFEQVVLDLLIAMGYGGSRKEAAAVTRKTSDEGIDGVINEDRLGLDVIYVQAKRWKGKIGREEMHSFVGALAGKKASKGVFITTSSFNGNALDYAGGLHQKVVLIDGSD